VVENHSFQKLFFCPRIGWDVSEAVQILETPTPFIGPDLIALPAPASTNRCGFYLKIHWVVFKPDFSATYCLLWYLTIPLTNESGYPA
jgi:hypothetical protein